MGTECLQSQEADGAGKTGDTSEAPLTNSSLHHLFTIFPGPLGDSGTAPGCGCEADIILVLREGHWGMQTWTRESRVACRFGELREAS